MSYQQLLEEMMSVFRELDSSRTIVSIPAKLGTRIEENIKDSDFKNLSEYVTFILRLMLVEEAKGSEDKDLERIRKRLKELGYL